MENRSPLLGMSRKRGPDGTMIWYQKDSDGDKVIVLRAEPKPNCRRCGIAQKLGQVIYCACMKQH